MNDKAITANGKSYGIIKLLGKGKGGYSYLASHDNTLVVEKKIHHEPCSYYSFGNKIEAEINDYKKLKEIGIRMAIGARVSDIRWQFLIESFLLSMIGGLIGVAVGIGGSLLITILAPSMTISISMFSIILALCFSALVGVGFGYYPAYKASLLNPIDALRYE